MNTPDPTMAIIALIAIILIFFLIRELVLWYYKINKRVKLQQLTLETLLKIYEQNGGAVDWPEVNKILDKN